MSAVMLDLATLGQVPGSVIVAIGAVKFTAAGLEDAWFYQRVDAESCVRAGLKIDARTVQRWVAAPEEMRATLLEPGQTLLLSLRSFALWLSDELAGARAEMWSCDNGAAQLFAAYQAAGVPCPWNPNEERCSRTLQNLRPDVLPPAIPACRAIDRARARAEHLVAILKALGPTAVMEDVWELFERRGRVVRCSACGGFMRPVARTTNGSLEAVLRCEQCGRNVTTPAELEAEVKLAGDGVRETGKDEDQFPQMWENVEGVGLVPKCRGCLGNLLPCDVSRALLRCDKCGHSVPREASDSTEVTTAP